MPRKLSHIIYLVTFVIATVAGYLHLVYGPFQQGQKSSQQSTRNKTYSPTGSDDLQASRRRSTAPSRDPSFSELNQTTPANALPNERIASFSDEASYQRFLSSMGARGLSLLGRSDRFRTVHFSFLDSDQLDGLEEAELDYNYLVTIPDLPQISAQAGATGFGNSALQWLGVTGDNSQWGQGVTVAVLDTGVNEHLAFDGGLSQIELTELEAGSEQLGHGTAVASIISGDHPLTPGVAPASEILSIRITDDSGSSSSYTLAEGIIQAVDAGADVINVSMGSYGDSNFVANAVRYAQENGAVIVASSGNEGFDYTAYPAAYDGVISVGAVEATGQHLDFSNSDDNLSITAPGFEISAAWGVETLTPFSGTSASAPFVSGAIAATMSENPELTSTEAAQRVLTLTNDAGLPGSDPNYGGGTLDLGRIMEYGTAGIYDIAISSQMLLPDSSAAGQDQILVSVQNQGTEILINSPLSVNSPAGITNVSINSLAPGETYSVYIPLPSNSATETITVRSSVSTEQLEKQISNNRKQTNFVPAP